VQTLESEWKNATCPRPHPNPPTHHTPKQENFRTRSAQLVGKPFISGIDQVKMAKNGQLKSLQILLSGKVGKNVRKMDVLGTRHSRQCLNGIWTKRKVYTS
jgi:hypothetical protein